MSSQGSLNFLGEKHIQSQCPLTGYTPEVSILVLKPAWRKRFVRAFRLYIRGSPPVITASRPGYCKAPAMISSKVNWSCKDASQDSFTDRKSTRLNSSHVK